MSHPSTTKRLKTAIKKGVYLLSAAALVYGCTAQKQVTGIAEIESSPEKPTLIAAERPTINAIKLDQTLETMVVNIVASQSLIYTSVKQSFPLGVAVYLPGTFLSEGVQSSPLQGMGPISSIVVAYADQGMKTARVDILLSENLDYEAISHASGLTLVFQRESSDIILTGKGETMASAAAVKPLPDQNQAQALDQKIEPNPKPGYFDKKIYTGEKIRLDFFETDIKNVFRILRSVSGKNFAVDKDVTGSVTMTLEEPVPWDQVLDLVLKMNRLGQVQEGTIVRIATLATMAQEQQLNQDAVAAHKATLEQEKSLEPLVTEYIPINYSSAETDVKPHLEKILTPDRGVLSVDGRTNMVILTDVKEKIDQAKELIRRLDKVTPQIMISARVVEVNKRFSKSLGINWGVSRENVSRGNLGGSYGFNVAMNYPVVSQGSLGFDFSNIFGTSAELNATLSASEIKGDVKIISSPKILTLDNKKAKIKQGLEYAYLERDDSGGSAVKFKNIDLLLEVTPHVTPDHRIAMSVLITKNDLASVVEGVPSLSTNEAETELLVNDGNTIVIGGIVKNTSSASANGFPGFLNIPLLGRLFGSDTTEDNKNELLIFITPTIVQLEQRSN